MRQRRRQWILPSQGAGQTASSVCLPPPHACRPRSRRRRRARSLEPDENHLLQHVLRLPHRGDLRLQVPELGALAAGARLPSTDYRSCIAAMFSHCLEMAGGV